MTYDTIIQGIITGLSAGIGSTIGAWLVNRLLISRVEAIEQKIKHSI